MAKKGSKNSPFLTVFKNGQKWPFLGFPAGPGLQKGPFLSPGRIRSKESNSLFCRFCEKPPLTGSTPWSVKKKGRFLTNYMSPAKGKKRAKNPFFRKWAFLTPFLTLFGGVKKGSKMTQKWCFFELFLELKKSAIIEVNFDPFLRFLALKMLKNAPFEAT